MKILGKTQNKMSRSTLELKNLICEKHSLKTNRVATHSGKSGKLR